MRIRAGTSGYAYAEWKGSFYPEDLPAKAFFAYYAARFDTVEVNATFYRMPKESVLASWAKAAPPGFTYALKAPQTITHHRRLKADAVEPAGWFWSASEALGAARGPILFGLPPNLKKDLPRLRAFLAALPEGGRFAFEFRNPSWFDDEVYDALRERRAALCVAEAAELATPLVATADWGYLRLRKVDYDDDAVAAWAARVRAQPWTEAFVYFKHEDAGTGPRLATAFLERTAS